MISARSSHGSWHGDRLLVPPSGGVARRPSVATDRGLERAARYRWTDSTRWRPSIRLETKQLQKCTTLLLKIITYCDDEPAQIPKPDCRYAL